MVFSPHFATDREAAEGMRLVRAWEITRALLSINGDHEVDKAIRLPPSHQARKHVGLLMDTLGQWPETARKNLTAFPEDFASNALRHVKLSESIEKIDTLLGNSRIHEHSPQAEALRSLKKEFLAIQEIRNPAISLSPEHKADARAMLDRNGSGGLNLERRHFLNADGTTLSNVAINEGKARITALRAPNGVKEDIAELTNAIEITANHASAVDGIQPSATWDRDKVMKAVESLLPKETALLSDAVRRLNKGPEAFTGFVGRLSAEQEQKIIPALFEIAAATEPPVLAERLAMRLLQEENLIKNPENKQRVEGLATRLENYKEDTAIALLEASPDKPAVGGKVQTHTTDIDVKKPKWGRVGGIVTAAAAAAYAGASEAAAGGSAADVAQAAAANVPVADILVQMKNGKSWDAAVTAASYVPVAGSLAALARTEGEQARFDSAQEVMDVLPKDVETLRAMAASDKLPPEIRHLAEGKMMMEEHYWDANPALYQAGKDILEKTASKIYEDQEKHRGGGMEAALAAAKEAGCASAGYACTDASPSNAPPPPRHLAGEPPSLTR